MATVRSTVSLAIAEVGDESVESLLASGQWELADAPVRKPRTSRVKAAPAVEAAPAASEE